MNGVAMVPVPTVIAKPKSTLKVEVRGDDTQTAELVVRGLLVGLGRAVKATTAYPTV